MLALIDVSVIFLLLLVSTFLNINCTYLIREVRLIVKPTMSYHIRHISSHIRGGLWLSHKLLHKLLPVHYRGFHTGVGHLVLVRIALIRPGVLGFITVGLGVRILRMGVRGWRLLGVITRGLSLGLKLGWGLVVSCKSAV